MSDGVFFAEDSEGVLRRWRPPSVEEAVLKERARCLDATLRFNVPGHSVVGPVVANIADAIRDAIYGVERMTLADAITEIADLKRRLGGGCDAVDGGDHLVMRQGRHPFCGQCGETLKGVRYCHTPNREPS